MNVENQNGQPKPNENLPNPASDPLADLAAPDPAQNIDPLATLEDDQQQESLRSRVAQNIGQVATKASGFVSEKVQNTAKEAKYRASLAKKRIGLVSIKSVQFAGNHLKAGKEYTARKAKASKDRAIQTGKRATESTRRGVERAKSFVIDESTLAISGIRLATTDTISLIRSSRGPLAAWLEKDLHKTWNTQVPKLRDKNKVMHEGIEFHSKQAVKEITGETENGTIDPTKARSHLAAIERTISGHKLHRTSVPYRIGAAVGLVPKVKTRKEQILKEHTDRLAAAEASMHPSDRVIEEVVADPRVAKALKRDIENVYRIYLHQKFGENAHAEDTTKSPGSSEVWQRAAHDVLVGRLGSPKGVQIEERFSGRKVAKAFKLNHLDRNYIIPEHVLDRIYVMTHVSESELDRYIDDYEAVTATPTPPSPPPAPAPPSEPQTLPSSDHTEATSDKDDEDIVDAEWWPADQPDPKTPVSTMLFGSVPELDVPKSGGSETQPVKTKPEARRGKGTVLGFANPEKVLELKHAIDFEYDDYVGHHPQVVDPDQLAQARSEITQYYLQQYFGATLDELHDGKKIPVSVQKQVNNLLGMTTERLEEIVNKQKANQQAQRQRRQQKS